MHTMLAIYFQQKKLGALSTEKNVGVLPTTQKNVDEL